MCGGSVGWLNREAKNYLLQTMIRSTWRCIVWRVKLMLGRGRLKEVDSRVWPQWPVKSFGGCSMMLISPKESKQSWTTTPRSSNKESHHEGIWAGIYLNPQLHPLCGSWWSTQGSILQAWPPARNIQVCVRPSPANPLGSGRASIFMGVKESLWEGKEKEVNIQGIR